MFCSFFFRFFYIRSTGVLRSLSLLDRRTRVTMGDGDEGAEFMDAVEGPEEEKVEEVTSKLAAATFDDVRDIAMAREEKEKGNNNYKLGHLDLAIEYYTAAIGKCPLDECYKDELV